MIKNQYKRFFHTLANQTRLEIIHILHQRGSMNVGDLTDALGCKQSTTSHNLKRLVGCEFVHFEQRGQYRYYSLNKETISPLMKIIDNHVKKFCSKPCNNCK
jgi:ArsR family transcriptional regulator, arsenate/arsenite/antimonite-responsive transcriptional repressor